MFQWNQAEPHGRALLLEDARVDVGVTSLDEPHAYASILCRHQGRDDYYQFIVTSDGTYEIHKKQAGRQRILVPRTEAPELKRDQLRIQVACIGGPGLEAVQLMLWAGGKGLARVSDTQRSLPPGGVAIGAGTHEENGYAEVAFTRFTLHQLTG